MKWIIGCGVFLSVILSSCSSMTVIRTQEMQKVGDGVQKSLSTQMTAEVATLKLQMDSLREENARLQKRSTAELLAMQSSLKESIEQSQVRHEELLFRLDAIAKSTAGVSKKVIAVSGKEKESGAPEEVAVPAKDSVPVISSNPELDALYETARADFQRAEYKLAYDGFKQIYEKSKVGPMAENALYWMGLCLTETNQVDKSMVLYQKVLENFPNGLKACVVLLKLADHAATQGKREDQAKYLEALAAKNQCRDTNEAYKALEMLDLLRGTVP